MYKGLWRGRENEKEKERVTERQIKDTKSRQNGVKRRREGEEET